MRSFLFVIFFRRALVPVSFAPNRVERIETVDSRWEGQLIGAATGVAATALLVAAAPPEDDQYATFRLVPEPSRRRLSVMAHLAF